VSERAPRAELLADGGQAAAGGEFFRSPPFLSAEGVTHTLRIGPLAAPVVVREIPAADGLLDAASPYGYPGFEGTADPPLDAGEIDLATTGLVSAFVRHRLDSKPPLTGATARNLVQLADPALPRKSRMSDRQQIRRNERRGSEVRIIPGPETEAGPRHGFLRAYEETMQRASARSRYFFGAEYFARILRSERSWLALALEAGGEVTAASIAAASDGMLHYYLSGTADAHLRDSPMKNLVAALVDFAWERGLPLNLGGGLTRGDRLEEFKRGFANREQTWHTSELVCDRRSYERLSAGRGGDGFFPAYRAPARG
jgi:hypothetical protein